MENPKILIVDDEVEILDLLEKKLVHEGFQVLKANHGREAVNKTKAFSPDLIVMDIIMPEMDGPETVRLILDDNPAHYIPILFLSGILTQEENDGEKINPEVTVGSNSYPSIPKPFDSREILQKIREMLKIE